MALRFKLEIPQKEQVRVLRLLSPRPVAWAEAQACNRTANNVKSKALKRISEEVPIDKKDLKKRGRGTSGHGVTRDVSANVRRLEAWVTAFGRAFNVTRFNAVQQKGKGEDGRWRVVGTTHSAYNRRQYAPRAWKLHQKGVPVVHRDKAKGYIDGVFGPSPGWVMSQPHVARELEALAVKKFPQHFVSRLRYALSAQSHVR